MKLPYFIVYLLLFLYMPLAHAGINLEVRYPYSLEQKHTSIVENASIKPLYLEITNFDNALAQTATIEVWLPEDFTILPNDKWQVIDKNKVKSLWQLPANYGQSFDLLYLKPGGNTSGEKTIHVFCKSENYQCEKQIKFSHQIFSDVVVEKNQTVDKSKFNWYIQSVTLPVDSLGYIDDKTAVGTIYVRDTSLEGFRNRILGEGTTNWSAVFNHPAAFLALEMRNPQQDIRLLKFKAQLVDRNTGKLVEGLVTAGKVNEETEYGWAGATENNDESTALISLDGQKQQTFILPLYVDYFSILEGDYSLKITVSGNGQENIQEVPLKIAKKHSIGILAVAIAVICFLFTVFGLCKLPCCIKKIGAKGAITVALFAALAFGGITLPTTLLGDILHIFLGPFAGLCTGILSSILQYLLITSLVILLRTPGVIMLMLLVKYMLSGLILGHFTPLGILNISVHIVVLESILWCCNFYKQETIKNKYMFSTAILLGLGDACITFINLEQTMFFYRLYYADWYLALYVLINGLLYSSIGAWLGYKMGDKLQQVMGE